MSKLFYYKDIIINFLLSFFFSVRVEGEPVDLSYPEPSKELPPVDQAFFEWSKEFRVGCQSKSSSVFY